MSPSTSLNALAVVMVNAAPTLVVTLAILPTAVGALLLTQATWMCAVAVSLSVPLPD